MLPFQDTPLDLPQVSKWSIDILTFILKWIFLQIAAKRREVVMWKAKSAVDNFVTLQVLVNKVSKQKEALSIDVDHTMAKPPDVHDTTLEQSLGSLGDRILL